MLLQTHYCMQLIIDPIVDSHSHVELLAIEDFTFAPPSSTRVMGSARKKLHVSDEDTVLTLTERPGRFVGAHT